jgi:uncharacterized protein (TIGR00106 family)
MVVLEFSMYPLDKGEGVSDYVARCVQMVEQSGLDYRCHAMGTLVEGDLDQVLGVVKRCFEELASDCNRIECSLRFDYRRGRTHRLEGKVASIEQKLGRPVKR